MPTYARTCNQCRTRFNGDRPNSRTCPACKVTNDKIHRSREQDLVTAVRIRPSRKVRRCYDGGREEVAAGISMAADRLNRLQVLTIRQFLTLVFCALVSLLLVLAVWS